MKILVNCIACSPYKGSEPGMGWNFIREIALKHELHILCASSFQNEIELYLEKNPKERTNKHFYFITKSNNKLLEKIYPPSYYLFYREWQKKAYRKAIELDKSLKFDLVHQLNMVGYREPGFLWKMDKPLIWGPIGGFNITPWSMLTSMGFKGCLHYLFRNIINIWQMHNSRRVKQAMQRANALIAATQNEASTMLKLYGRESTIIPEVGFSGKQIKFTPHNRCKALKVCWSGLFKPRKSLNLLIEATKIVTSDVELHILGDGGCANKWKKMAAKIPNLKIHWYGWLERTKSMDIMQKCDVFCITSLSDLTSTVLLEALSFGLPVIALNHCGFTNVITDECGIKIPIRNKKQVIKDIAMAIDSIAMNEDKRKSMSVAAYKRSLLYGWKEKGEMIDQIYKNVLEINSKCK